MSIEGQPYGQRIDRLEAHVLEKFDKIEETVYNIRMDLRAIDKTVNNGISSTTKKNSYDIDVLKDSLISKFDIIHKFMIQHAIEEEVDKKWLGRVIIIGCSLIAFVITSLFAATWWVVVNYEKLNIWKSASVYYPQELSRKIDQ